MAVSDLDFLAKTGASGPVLDFLAKTGGRPVLDFSGFRVKPRRVKFELTTACINDHPGGGGGGG